MGLSCSLRCHCDGGGACDIDTGACPGGRCQSGWSGQSCFVGPRVLSYGKTTRQSSTDNKNVPGKAVDGIITKDVVPKPGSCSHTDLIGNHPEAWWEVDLGGVKQIQTINIVYRQLYIFRMSGFYLYVSNSSVAHNIHQVLRTAHLCYHDHGPGLPSYIQSLSCPVSGQYVIFYNRRPADYEPRDAMYYNKTTAVIELCEVQVLGACTNHTFGRDCTQTCHCANSDCDGRTGVCKLPGCTEGWRGQTCSQACTNHTYGRDCTQTCHCAYSDCDRRTGVCNVPGCTEGWRADMCSQACTNHTFGQDCTQTCQCANSDCDRRTGVCKVPGCMEGWRGDSCSQACTNHTFGQDCNQTCHCANSDCDRRTGVCKVPGCMEGWRGDTCNQECQYDHFGDNCSKVCHCQVPGCDHVSGLCFHVGCQKGWSGPTCSKRCIGKTFGRDCIQTCYCANSDCDKRTGVCKVPGCTEGWRGQTCSQECRTGYFGPNCTEECHCQSPGCHHINGTCHNVGCEAGWLGRACDQECLTGYFGPNCTEECHCQSPGCNHTNGTCHHVGCEAGWSGRACDQAQKQTETKAKTCNCEEGSTYSQNNTGYAVIGSILTISIGCNIGFIIHCIRVYGKNIRTPAPSTELHTYHMPDHDDNYDGIDSTKIDIAHNVYDSIGKYSGQKVSE
ncbi:protein draper-like [Argopecten irradians]|uniref:protein draper-like n=1 Tax=Argopecten irradians TaxID=31199 RepID=UPI003716CD1B